MPEGSRCLGLKRGDQKNADRDWRKWLSMNVKHGPVEAPGCTAFELDDSKWPVLDLARIC